MDRHGTRLKPTYPDLFPIFGVEKTINSNAINVDGLQYDFNISPRFDLAFFAFINLPSRSIIENNISAIADYFANIMLRDIKGSNPSIGLRLIPILLTFRFG